MKRGIFCLSVFAVLLGTRESASDAPREPKAVLKRVMKMEKAGKLSECASLLEGALKENPGCRALRRRLYKINKKIFLTPAAASSALCYVVKRGDTLSKIGRLYNIPAALIKRLNGLKNAIIFPGQRLKVVKGPFHLRIIKKEFLLEVLRKKKVLFTYRVGLGEEGSTPAGSFKAGAKLKNPTQFHYKAGEKIPFGSPGHTIGTRWITFNGQYGIHGTVEPDSIGKNMSRGCVRMRNKDLEKVFDLVVPGKTKVYILKARREKRAAKHPGSSSRTPSRPAQLRDFRCVSSSSPGRGQIIRPVPAVGPCGTRIAL